jgi:C-terminal processing protease CtpA/Prc
VDQALRLRRLEALADLWGKVYLFHPAIVTPSPYPSPSGRGEGEGAALDWNQALTRAIPRVEAAETAAELVNALNEELLSLLCDPLTFAVAGRDRGIERLRDQVDEGGFQAGRIADSVGYVRVPPPTSRGPAFLTEFQAAVEGLGDFDKLVVDLRWPAAPGGRICEPILRFFVRSALTSGPVMNRVHEGWSEDNGLGPYRQKWEVIVGSALHPIQEPDWYLAALCPGTDFARLKTVTKSTVFLVNRPSATGYYKVLDALQSQPGIAVVLETTGPPEETLRLAARDWGLGTGESVEVQLNTERLVAHDGSAGFRPDLVLERPLGLTELPAIVEQALAGGTRDEERGTRDEAAKLMNLRLPMPLPEAGRGLTREERLLGLFKVWSVVRHVYPHIELCDMDWETCLPEWIPKVEAAGSAIAYVRTLRMLTAHLHDNNIFYYFPDLPEPQALPIGFGWIEGKIVVTDLIDAQITQIGASGSGPDPVIPSLQIGDELVEFDGKTVPELVAEHRLQFSYSTEGAFQRHMAEMLGFGTAGAEVKLAFRRGEQLLSLTLRRTVTREAWVGHLAHKREPGTYRMLQGNLGYMDLCRMPNLAEFDRAFEALRHADGWIIDLRGYPGFMVQLALSSRLSDQPVKSAIFEIPVVSGFARLEQGWNAGQYEVQPDPAKHYGGPVVVLINERTFGGSEDICIYLRNANRASFVGHTTAGCNGNRAWLSLPGGGRLWFTGMRVKFGDGSRFQNVGIVPDVPAAPTVDGFKAGRDEVLEKGIEVIRDLVHRPSSSAPAHTKDEGRNDQGRGAS